MSTSQAVSTRSGANELRSQLDSVLDQIENGAVNDGMAELFTSLRRWRRSPPEGTWEEVIQQHCLNHPVSGLIYQDPMTFHSYSQPRGYPGDAELLDYIYGVKPCTDSGPVSPVGSAIHQFLRQQGASRAVCARRGILAELVDRVAATTRNPRVLSVAAGHLREVELSTAVRRRGIGEYLAFDQDEESLKCVENNYSEFGVRVVHGSVRELLSGRQVFGDLDCAYAAGLYDYLQQKTARRLTKIMFDALKSGGRLLVANFLPDITDVGYMESFMGWQLIYRSRLDLLDVTDEISLDAVEDIRLFSEPNKHILFLEIHKR